MVHVELDLANKVPAMVTENTISPKPVVMDGYQLGEPPNLVMLELETLPVSGEENPAVDMEERAVLMKSGVKRLLRVEKILREWIAKGVQQFLVKWQNYQRPCWVNDDSFVVLLEMKCYEFERAQTAEQNAARLARMEGDFSALIDQLHILRDK